MSCCKSCQQSTPLHQRSACDITRPTAPWHSCGGHHQHGAMQTQLAGAYQTNANEPLENAARRVLNACGVTVRRGR